MLFHRVGKRGAALDIGAGLQDGVREPAIRFPGAEQLQTGHEREAGVDHHGELPCERGQAPGLHGTVPA